MSHIDNVTPAGPLTLAPGASIDFVVLVSGVPGDDLGTLNFSASDGSIVSVNVTIDRAALEGILTGTPAGNQVLGKIVTGPGSLSVGSLVTGGIRFRYTAV